jgi:hypothetical protein
MYHIRHGMIAIGAFYALSEDVNGWLVFLFMLLLWGFDYDKSNKGSE